MRLVVIESPYAGDTPEAIQANVDYGRRCLADSLSRGEAPFASHLLYTQPGVLDDANPGQRSIGIAAGLQWSAASNFTAVYYDRGLSKGMKEGLRNAIRLGLQVELRSLEGRQTLTAARCPDGSGYELRSPNWQAMLPGAGVESFVLLIKNWVDGALESSPRPAKRPHLMEEVKAIAGEVGFPTSEPVGEIEEDKEGYPWKRIGYIHAWRIADLPVGTKLYAAPQSGRAAELTAEVERLRKDAERYRHLRDSLCCEGYPSSEGSSSEDAYLVITGYNHLYPMTSDQKDAAIYAAIAKTTGKEAKS